MTRDELTENIIDIFGNIDNFLDIVEYNMPPNWTFAVENGECAGSGEVFVIDRKNNQYIGWYKLTHVGRDSNTNMIIDNDIFYFLQRLKMDYLEYMGDVEDEEA